MNYEYATCKAMQSHTFAYEFSVCILVEIFQYDICVKYSDRCNVFKSHRERANFHELKTILSTIQTQ